MVAGVEQGSPLPWSSVRNACATDFSGATRGKYLDRYLESTNVVVLDPDVAERYPTSESVNTALRSLDPERSKAAERR